MDLLDKTAHEALLEPGFIQILANEHHPVDRLLASRHWPRHKVANLVHPLQSICLVMPGQIDGQLPHQHLQILQCCVTRVWMRPANESSHVQGYTMDYHSRLSGYPAKPRTAYYGARSKDDGTLATVQAPTWKTTSKSSPSSALMLKMPLYRNMSSKRSFSISFSHA